eukprot:CAMPEP_0185739438 /NCGR_PEP_ID=MMETSP1171-20130828/35445_1 /TAXON_ID=374046 /ORGANISM="Helicotheca tamensis, Strain CCMP826" /LENGTH=80 /DNA_ID=CAMNT_0028411007 /DNA_START=361 /DNA_END=600 /DNA_ORIENTATION=-
MAPAANPINSAFDDLLGLASEPVPSNSPELASMEPPTTKAASSKKGNKQRVWQRGTIKASHAEQTPGSGMPIDWDKISLL